MATSVITVIFCIYTCLLWRLYASIRPYRLRVEYMQNPYGIDVASPRFFWSVSSNHRGAEQTAYRIKIYNVSANWPKELIIDSGIIKSNSCSQIVVRGFTVSSHTDYSWNVVIYDSSNTASTNNPDASFTGGLVGAHASDWNDAEWIGIPDYEARANAYQIRNSNITLLKAFSRIKCYIAMPGYYKAWINNQLIDDHALGYFTTFEKRIYYDVIPCTDKFRVGKNVFGIWLGNGWYSEPSIKTGPPMFKLLIRVEFSDDSIQYFKTNNVDYYQHKGPIRMNDIYDGEWYDASMETRGWMDTNYKAVNNGWTLAKVITSPTVGTLSSSAIMPKAKKVETYTALTMTEPKTNVFVFDLGQNIAGLTRITIPGNNLKGHNMTVIHGEEIDVNGVVVNLYSNSPMIGIYTFRGDGNPEVFEASFTYYGFQYVQIEGYPANSISQNCIRSYFIHSDVDTTVGSINFAPSNINNEAQNGYLLNRVQHMTRYAALSNYINIPTDCPQRERRGWLGDAQLTAITNIHNFDMAAAYTKFLLDIQDTQEFINSKGALPDCVPYYGHGQNPGDPSWTTAYTFIAYWMWRYYGDQRVIVQHYDSIKLQLHFLESQLDPTSGLLPNSVNHYGDWCALKPQGSHGCAHKSGLISTYDWAKQCFYFSQMANAIGNTADSSAYWSKYDQAKQAIYNNYWDESKMQFVDPLNQAPPSTLNALALDLGVLHNNTAAIASTAKAIADYEIAQDQHISAGIIGVKYIYAELCKHGYCHLAMNETLQTTMPSYGYWVTQKATTLWENWDSSQYRAHGSKNHIMFGAQGAWYYQYLAGIRQTHESNNWDTIIIDPYTNASMFDITSISATIQTYKGAVSSRWSTNITANGLCGDKIAENTDAILKCTGSGTIHKILFASYGTPSGSCGSFEVDTECNNNNTMSIVQQLCLGKESCSVPVSNNEFKYDPCAEVAKYLSVEVECTNTIKSYLQMDVIIPTGSTALVMLKRTAFMKEDISEWMVQENGVMIWQNMKFVNADNGVIDGEIVDQDSLLFTIKSGFYTFVLFVDSVETAL